jgi:hypothetical protein
MSPARSFRLASSTHAPGVARAHLREFLDDSGVTAHDRTRELQFVSVLLTSELVTHAVEHGNDGAGDMVLMIDLSADTLHTELSLGDVAIPIDVLPFDESRLAYGLVIIDSLAERWGGNRTEHGTSLWFDLDVAQGMKR